MNLPRSYLLALLIVAVVGGGALLVYLGVPPFNQPATFLLANLVGALTLVVFGVLGGAFVGMLLAYRILSARDFSPFEKRVLSVLEELQETNRRILKILDEKRR